MGTENRSSVKTETRIAVTLKKKFKAKVNKEGTSEAQVLRDLIQKYIKG